MDEAASFVTAACTINGLNVCGEMSSVVVLYCIVLYYQLFQNMEDSGILNVDDEVHLLFLHYVFLPRINDSLQQFVSMWNHHPLGTESNLSLVQLWMTGEHPCDNHNDLDAEECFNCTQCIAFVV